jgi:hypothetical protein
VADATAFDRAFCARIDSWDGSFFGLSQQEHGSVLFSSVREITALESEDPSTIWSTKA